MLGAGYVILTREWNSFGGKQLLTWSPEKQCSDGNEVSLLRLLINAKFNKNLQLNMKVR